MRSFLLGGDTTRSAGPITSRSPNNIIQRVLKRCGYGPKKVSFTYFDGNKPLKAYSYFLLLQLICICLGYKQENQKMLLFWFNGCLSRNIQVSSSALSWLRPPRHWPRTPPCEPWTAEPWSQVPGSISFQMLGTGGPASLVDEGPPFGSWPTDDGFVTIARIRR